MAGLHVDGVDALAVGRVGVADRQLRGVVLGLADAFSQGFIPRLRFDGGQLRVAIFQNVVSLQRLAPPPVAFDTTKRNRVLTADSAAVNNAPARRCECGVDVFGSGFGFVHGVQWIIDS